MKLRGRIVAFSMLIFAVAVVLAVPAFPFLPELTGTPPQADRWDMSAFPVQWNLNPNTAGAKITGSKTAAQVMNASFATWMAAPNTSITVTRGADSAIGQQSNAPGNVNLICFVCNDSGLFGGSETLAVTVTTTADRVGESDNHGGASNFVGQIIQATISFNPAVQFDTGGGVGQDMQTVATHEIGHFFGLDHSAITRATMYPIAPDQLETLSYDDAAGISGLYPKSSPDVLTGSISGSVTLNGSAVFGAHVFANSTTSASPFGGFPNMRKTPIGTLTLPDGSYTITGVPADTYLVMAEPLDAPVTDSDVSWASEFNKGSVQTNFTSRWH